MKSVGIVIPTYKAVSNLPRLLPHLQRYNSTLPILLVDSSSNDGTVEYARQFSQVEVVVIRQSEFNHGLTREFGRKKIGTDIAVMITQDAIPVQSDCIDKLIAPLFDGRASISYARQLPREGAGFFESFPRDYNYPPQNEIRSIEDFKRLGAFIYFCSDSCAAWSNEALNEIAGFEYVLTGEDTIAAAKLLQRGHRIAYAADALVRHSHDYSLTEEMKRYFDIGFQRNQLKELLLGDSKDEKRGSKFTKAMFARLLKERPLSIPYGLMNVGAKYLGYQLGKHARLIPRRWWKTLSGQPYFWKCPS